MSISLPPDAFNTLPPTMLEDDGFDATWAMAPQHLVGPIRTTPRRRVPSAFVPPTPPHSQDFSFKIPQNASDVQSPGKETDDLDPYDGVGRSELLALTALSGIWNVLTGASGLLIKSVQYVRGKIQQWNEEENAGHRESRRFDPMSRAGRGKRRQDRDNGDEFQSMLALPPHMVGATPKIVRQDRQQHEKKKPTPSTPPESLDAAKLQDWNLFHATPHPAHRPEPTPSRVATAGKRVRFAESNEDKDESAQATVTPLRKKGVLKRTGTPTTPMFVFNTPDNERKALTKKEEFDMNLKKGLFNSWLKFLHDQGISVRVFQKGLRELTLPTEVINKIWSEKNKHPEKWDTFVKCWTHQGFLKRLGITIPTVEFPEPKDWEKEKQNARRKINFESPIQQKDGCCKNCRGYNWAGSIETREILPGDNVEMKSWHKTFKPYSREEERDFAKHKYDALYTRWCRESRYDWIFEKPKELEGNKEWEIPVDDPRLRHITRVKMLTKLSDTDIMSHRSSIIKQYSAQDLAAERFISAVERENKAIGALLRKMDLERKRQQVRTEFLCVQQVKVVPPQEQEVKEPSPEKPTLNEAHKRPRLAVEGGGKRRRTGIETSKVPTPAGKKTLPLKKRQPLVKKKHANVKPIAAPSETTFNTTLDAPAFDPQQLKTWKPATHVMEQQPWTDGWSAAYEESIKKVPRQWRNKGMGCYSAWEEDLPELTREEIETVTEWEAGRKMQEAKDKEEKWRRLEREEEEMWKKEREERAAKIQKMNDGKLISFAK
ncbi:hypothetical protein RUND412_008633 [Rhizina undulata]